uniref:DUF4200 domain-containing protein n=2 Tax=Macrostomum lignano TaxID=282301 RepID=A0A1I8H4T7_9PLAT
AGEERAAELRQQVERQRGLRKRAEARAAEAEARAAAATGGCEAERRARALAEAELQAARERLADAERQRRQQAEQLADLMKRERSAEAERLQRLRAESAAATSADLDETGIDGHGSSGLLDYIATHDRQLRAQQQQLHQPPDRQTPAESAFQAEQDFNRYLEDQLKALKRGSLASLQRHSEDLRLESLRHPPPPASPAAAV